VICPSCYGVGWKYLSGSEECPYPCDVCESRGHLHCCEGDCATNDSPPVPVHQAFDIKREHVASIDCWCGPVEVEEGVFIHYQVT